MTGMRVCIGYSGATPVGQTFAAIDAAEASGLDGVWSAEHVGLNDAIVPSVAYALRTSRVEIGLVGLNADTRHPGVLAMELATLSSLAPGRIRIQVGTGSPTRAVPIGVTAPRTVRGVETLVSSLRGLLRGEEVTAQSEAFTLAGLRLKVEDTPPIPVDIMAIRPRMTELAARVADGVSLSAGASREYLRRRVAEVSAALERYGRPREKFRISAVALAAFADDMATARQLMAPLAATFSLGGAPEMRADLEMPDKDRLREVLAQEGPAAAGKLLSDATVEGLGLVATPETIGDAVAAYRDTGIDELVVMPAGEPAGHPHLVRCLAGTR
jgi:5,10-methylenetetrahydromethanopterin reductase